MHTLLTFSIALFLTGLVRADDDTSPLTFPVKPPPEGPYVAPLEPKYNYAEVMHKSYLFYHAQKSGNLPYQRMAWRGDSCKVCVGDYGEDLSHGWYEAANTMKWGLPFGWTVTQLAFNIMMFEDSMNSIDELAEGLELLKWGADYLVNAHHNDTHIVGQLGTSALGPISKQIELDVDFNYWGPPEEYEQWVPTGLPHKAYYITPDNPSSEIAGEYSAALAAISIPWRKHNATFADELVDRAKRMYNFATENPGSYVSSRQNAYQWAAFWYPSTRFEDELAWSAAWIYAATKEPEWLERAKKWYNASSDSWQEYSWDEKGGALHTLLYAVTKEDIFYKNAMDYFNQFLPSPKQIVKFTPRGLAYIEHWGSVGYSGNVAFLMMAFAKSIGYDKPESEALTTFSIQQINYALGDYGYSWVVGFGDNYPSKPYHKSSYNSYIDYPMRGQFQDKVEEDFSESKTGQRFILYGAVEGGPNVDDSWHDDRTNYEYSEVTQDYNAAWTGAIAGLIDYYGADKFEPYTDCDLDLGWSHPNASDPPAWPDDDCYHTCNTGCPRGEMKSSYSWRLLMEPETIKGNMDTLYPGEGDVRAATFEGSKVDDHPTHMANAPPDVNRPGNSSRGKHGINTQSSVASTSFVRNMSIASAGLLALTTAFLFF
ncbi:glycoside hydrolase family 9 protein [Phycomyces blakesleeanus]|uniref:Endoglucanase n=2 Tax=Phycomyces blakesleeanus TaxID=4837 RepID=A0A167QIB4_PHYB8|nr:glycoside hydrolase family 9 protein [Phycomyces blakesleeanus NRRL 1555(-)]OAD79738.1 glycoside hydrolase family 9 protein [Phycomyces blakesleeanus NRRL 1555(-)]|eukprot:XP_018297778.1 glycoside hydrolase family 9 protein [Phycomyces blakesleeanus NRRL 1555(-)]